MKGLYLRMDGSVIFSIENYTNDIYLVEFKENNIEVYSIYVNINSSVNIPYEVYNKYKPSVNFIKL